MLRRLSILSLSLFAIVFGGQSLEAAEASLTFSPSSVALSGSSGGQAVAQTVTMLNTGNAATNWTLNPSASWLTATPSSGIALAAGGSVTITVIANPASLNPSSPSGFTATLTPQGSGVNVPLTVTFSVSGAVVSVVPNPIPLSVLAGTQQVFQNVAQINGSAGISVTVTSGSWLTASAANQAPTPLSLTVNATSLTASSAPYLGSLVVYCSGSVSCITQTVPVNLTVYTQLTMSCTPTTGPVQAGVSYSTTCKASGGSNSYLWSIGAGSLASGLSLSSNTGNTIQVSGTPNTAGAYNYVISVNDIGGQFQQSASQKFSGTIAPPAPTTLTASPASLSFGTYIVGGTVPAIQNITLGSTSPASGLAFTSTLGSDCGWLTLSPAAGSTPVTVTASVNPANASLGSHSCLITFNASGVSPSPTVTATLTIGPGNKPVISALVNGAGFSPGQPLATGSWATVYGSYLAPAGDSRQWNPQTEIVNGAFPTSLDGTSVTVNGKHAAVEYISPTQVNIQLPDDTAVGPVQVVLTTTAGGASAAFTASYAQFAPGLFLATPSYLAAQHADGSYVGGYAGATPAKPGEVVTLWGTGFGPASPPVPAGQVFTGANTLANNLTVTIGGQPAAVEFAGIVGAGLVQINVYVPSSINNGDAPVLATIGGVLTQAAGNLITVHN